MKLIRFLLFTVFIVSFFNTSLYSQNTQQKKKSEESRYILRDSTGSYLIRELTLPDGTKSYSLIPKSYLEDTLGIDKNLPQTLQDWFYKNKKKNNNEISSTIGESDSLNTLLGKLSNNDNTAADHGKNKAAWWIVGSTTLIGGVVAYIFLKYRKGVDELPVQPDLPK
jgi:hypothetical protein